MKVLKLEIRKHDQYNDDYKDEIVGMVQITGETGKMEVRIRPGTVAKILRMCKEDVQGVANYNAAQVGTACDDAADTVLLEASNVDTKQIEG